LEYITDGNCSGMLLQEHIARMVNIDIPENYSIGSLRDETSTPSIPDDAVLDTGDQDDEEAASHVDRPESEDEPESEDGEVIDLDEEPCLLTNVYRLRIVSVW
jgi:hypothetical protein